MATATTGAGWPKHRTFDGQRFTLQGAHRKKGPTDAHARQLRAAPTPHLARVVGQRGRWAVYGRPAKKATTKRAPAKAKRATSARTSVPSSRKRTAKGARTGGAKTTASSRIRVRAHKRRCASELPRRDKAGQFSKGKKRAARRGGR